MHEIWLQHDGLLKLVDRLSVKLLLFIGYAQIVKRAGVIRIGFDRLLELVNGLDEFFLLEQSRSLAIVHSAVTGAILTQ